MIYRIHGTIQPYAWGGKTYIANLLRLPSDEYPKAELWFGDHPQAPALIDTTLAQQSLDDWIKKNPQVLSTASRRRFGTHLPYLLKVLDVRLPLSIQLHPNKVQAETGFHEEKSKNTPMNKRNYPDDNHKPESMIALSEFWLLHGFAEIDTIIARIAERPSLKPIAELLEKHTMHDTYARIMTADQETLSQWLSPLLAQPAPEQVSANPDYWLHYTKKAMNISLDALDPGLLSFYLFNIVHMKKGEGIFQPARLPHAYLRGQNIEVMAASNNVLRAGLTPKHIDIPELLKIIDCQSVTPKTIAAPSVGKLYNYPAPIDDYSVSTISLKTKESLQTNFKEATIILTISGKLQIKDKDTSISIQSGEAVFLPCNTAAKLIAEESSYLVIVNNR